MSEIDWYKMTERPEERELHRKIRRAAIMEWIGGILLAIIVVITFCLYIVATPAQSNAINDLEEVRGASTPDRAGESGLNAAIQDGEAR